MSAHAASRWRLRVGTGPPELAAFLACGKASKRPPRWADAPEGIGSTYVTNHLWPGVCVVVTNGAAVTVLTRRMAGASRVYAAEAVHVVRRKAMA